MKRWIRGLFRAGSRLVLVSGIVLALFLILLTQTAAGREWVLREVLLRVEGGIRGDIEVEGISSPGLLRGFTLHGITIRGEDGRTFLQADSVRARISGPAVLRGDLVFSGVQLWRPRVTLERISDQEEMNVVSIFVGGPPPDSLSPPPDSMATSADSLSVVPEGEGRVSRRTVILRDATLHEGTLDLFLPLSRDQRESGRVLVEPGSGGRPDLRRMTFREIEIDLGQAILKSPGQDGERFEVRNLSFTGEVWPDPFRVTGAEGEIRREGERLLASLRALNLPGSRARGRVDVRWGEDRGVRVAVQGEADPLDLDDISFIDARLPGGDARGPFGLELSDDGVLLDFEDTELTSGQGGIRARGGLFLGREMGFRDLALEMSDLDLAVTDSWVVDTLPLRGRLTGDLKLTGTLEELQVQGLLDLVDPDSVGKVTADISGQMGFLEGFSASPLLLTLAPLEWGALASVSPAMTLRGSGSVRLELTGSLEGDGLVIDADLTHVPAGGRASIPSVSDQVGRVALSTVGGASRVTVQGRVRRGSTDLILNLTSELSPLSLTTLRQSFPALPFEGEYTGRLELDGPVSDLEVAGDLGTSGGPLSVAARFDARHLARSYSLEAETGEQFVLSELLPSLPDPTRLSGRVSAVGRGFSLDSLQGRATLSVRQGEVGRLEVDSIAMEATVENGVLYLQDLVAETNLGTLTGSGFLGVASTSPPGELTLGIESESLEALRPLLMEEPPLIFDELSEFQKTLLIGEEVDLDTLPRAADVAVGGAVQGTIVLRGRFRGFTGEGSIDFQNLRFRKDYARSGTVTFRAENLPGDDRRIRAEISTDSVNIRSLGFRSGDAEVDIGISGGRVRVTAIRSPEEQYSAGGTYALDTLGGGTVNLDEFTLLLDTARWNLGGPASLVWNSEGYRVRDFQLIRPGDGFMRLRADGFLPLEAGAEGDFQLEVERLNLARLAQAIQMETPLEGVVDFRGRMTGLRDRPRIVGTASGRDLRYDDWVLGSVESDLTYEEERVNLELIATDHEDHVFRASGFFPADLRLRPDSSRMPVGPVDLRISADSFPAATVLVFMQAMEEVEGTLSGDIHLAGTSADLEPTGDLYLTGGSALLPGLGVRHRGVEAHLVLTPDGVVEVDGSLRSGGSARVTGTVRLRDPLSDPGLALNIDALDFLAVNRRDVQARLSGSLAITSTYRRPQVVGDLTVEQGVLIVEEVARSVEVVDLSDPAFFNVVDTTLVTLRPLILASQNPFLQNLRLNVNLTMAQDSWLRGRDMNIEMAGQLFVAWDRTQRNLAFLGVLDAVRGVYSVFGRQFQVEDGTVSFPGTPGVNPDLNIRAQNRLRTKDGNLDITATVVGPLLAPRVTLSSNSSFPIAESDLVSYLIFGQPSYALASGQRRAFAGAGASLAVGLFASELGSLLAQDVGLDYLAITQGQYSSLTPNLLGNGGIQAFGQTVRENTQVEIGQYLTENIFAALHWRPGATSRNQFAALRLETRLSDSWTLEGYWEDRFLHSGLWAGADLGQDFSKVFGFLFYRQWGY